MSGELRLPGIVLCDDPHCGHKRHVGNVIAFRDATCPWCGAALMSDGDKRIIDMLVSAHKAGLVAPPGERPAVAMEGDPVCQVHISTAHGKRTLTFTADLGTEGND